MKNKKAKEDALEIMKDFEIRKDKLVLYRGNAQNVEIPPQVRVIGEEAFSNSNVVSVKIPDTVTEIRDFAFYDCRELERVELPKSLVSIGKSSFAFCRSLKALELPQGVTRIANKAFYHCISLTSINLPDSVTELGERALEYCMSLEEIAFPDKIELIGERMMSDCIALKRVKLPSSLKRIGKAAFFDCESLEEITVPDSVTCIWEHAFSGCKSLQRAIISEKSALEKIGACAFYETNTLKELYVPSGVKLIGRHALSSSGIEKIYLMCPEAELEAGIFFDCSRLSAIECVGELLQRPIKYYSKVFTSNKKDTNALVLMLAMPYERQEEELPPLIKEIKDAPEIFSSLAILTLDGKALSSYLDILEICGPTELENFISIANEAQMTEKATFLLSYRNRKFTAEQIEQERLHMMNKELGFEEKTDLDYKREFKLEFKNGKAKLVKYTGNSRVVDIPKQICGCTVYEIGAGAFEGRSDISYIDVPDTVKKIGDRAFYGCKALGKINLPIGVSVGDEVFVGCDSMGDENGFFIVRSTLYNYCGNHTELSLPSTVKHIYPYAISNRPNLKALRLPEGIIAVPNNAFCLGIAIKDYYFPKSLKIINYNSFKSFYGVTVHAQSGTFAEQYARENRINFQEEKGE